MILIVRPRPSDNHILSWPTPFFFFQVMRSVHKAGQNYPAWKAQNVPDHKPWLYPEQNTLPMMDPAELAIQRADSLENVDVTSKEDDAQESEDST